MPSPVRLVAVVEPDDTLRESVCRALRLDDLRAEGFEDGARAWTAAERTLPDLAVIDMAVQGIEAPELCRRLRERSATLPIILVPAREDDLEAAAVAGIAADDYLCKPFSLKDLLPRVKMLLRRAALTGFETLAWEDRPLTLGALTVDPLRMTAQWRGQDVAISITEFLILHSLVRRAGVMKTRDQVLREAFPGRAVGDGSIEGYVARIRQKFERIDPAFDALESVHGAGYRYRAGRA